jgi:hypothetical protein
MGQAGVLLPWVSVLLRAVPGVPLLRASVQQAALLLALSLQPPLLHPLRLLLLLLLLLQQLPPAAAPATAECLSDDRGRGAGRCAPSMGKLVSFSTPLSSSALAAACVTPSSSGCCSTYAWHTYPQQAYTFILCVDACCSCGWAGLHAQHDNIPVCSHTAKG